MGCCLSTNNTCRRDPDPARPDEAHQFNARSMVPEPEHADHVGKAQNDRRDPPLPSPVVEEESVKEVLSETPIWRPQQEHKVMLDKYTHLPCNNHLHAEAKDVSETCGINESFSLSTATTTTTITTSTITEVRDQEDEATSKGKRSEVGYSTRARINGSHQANTRRKRPNSGDLAGRRERGRPVSPASRPEASAAKKRNRVEARSAGGREAVGQLRTMQRTVGSTGGARRDIGEVSSRRSRSPAKRTVGGVNPEGMGRSPSKATGRAGDRSLGVGVVEGGGTKEVQNDAVLQAGNESLENPLVSLECFIFL